MIDDNEEEDEDEEEDEEEEEEGDGEGKAGGGSGSEALVGETLLPSPSLEESHKHRPTTLHLTTLGAQVSFLIHTILKLSLEPRQPAPPSLDGWSGLQPH